MRDGNDIVFIEVRSRSRTDYGSASETINKSKQRKIIKTAIHFLQNNQWLYKVNSRFDIIALQLIANKWQLDWIKNAFFVEY
jgi:putative endonuclease